jgi:hypothetical protein
MSSAEFGLKIVQTDDGIVQLIAQNKQLPLDTIVMQLRVFVEDLDKRYSSAANITFINKPK